MCGDAFRLTEFAIYRVEDKRKTTKMREKRNREIEKGRKR
jgi:hypothetical protein